MEIAKSASIILLVILAFILGVERLHLKDKVQDLEDDVEYREMKYTSERTKNGNLVIKQKAMETYNKRFIDSITKDFDVKIKNVKLAVKYEYKTKIDSLVVHTSDSFFFYKNGERVKSFKDSTAYYTIEASVDSVVSRIKFDKIEFRDSILTVERTTGFLVKKTEIQIISKSPYSNISGVKSIKLKSKPRKGLKALEFLIVGFLGYKTYQYVHR